MTDRKLMQQALEALDSDNPEIQLRAAIALRERLAQPEQDGECPHCDGSGCVACDARKQPQQEPVAWITITDCGEEDDIWYENPEGKLLEGWTYKPLYTTPPRREWVGLTDEEADAIWDDYNLDGADVTRAIEAKLKEKNNG